jgi:hypothetical protein
VQVLRLEVLEAPRAEVVVSAATAFADERCGRLSSCSYQKSLLGMVLEAG